MILESFKFLLGFTAWSLLVTPIGAVCGPFQATNWSDPMGLYPSSPWRCDSVQTINETTACFELLDKFQIKSDDLLAWNCFLDSINVELAAGDQVCVNATEYGFGEGDFVGFFGFSHGMPPKSSLSKFISPFKRDVLAAAEQGPQQSGPARALAKTTQTLPEGVNITFTESFTTVTIRYEDSTTETTLPLLLTAPITSLPPKKTVTILDPFSSTSSSPDTKPTKIVPRNYVLSRNQSQATKSRASKSPSTVDPFAVFTDACDSGSFYAENCLATKHCNTSRREYPMCIDGKCKCKVKACSTNYECEQYKQCRSDEQKPICKEEPQLHPEKDGICRCEPKIKNCLAKGDDKHKFCSQQLNCTAQQVSHFPEFGQCIRGGILDRGKGGLCKCKQVDCVKGASKSDELCNELISCPGNSKAFCNLKYGPVDPMEKDGYCRCEGDLQSSAWHD